MIGALLDLVPTKKEGLIGKLKVKGSDLEMVEFRILRGGKKAKSKIDLWTSEKQSSGICLEESHGGKRRTRKSVDIQGSLFPSTRVVHPEEQEVKHFAKRPAWMNK